MLLFVSSVSVVVLIVLLYCLGLPGDHAQGEWLFTLLPLMIFMVVTNSVVSFPKGCLGWDLGLNLASS